MNLKRFWKETKHMLALVLAVALFFNGWTNYDFSVLAADELTVTLSAESAVYTGGDLTPDIKSVKDASDAEVDFAAANVTWKNSADEAVTEIINSDTYTVTVEVTESVDDGSGNVTDETHTGTATFKVDQLDLSACTVTADNVTYTGAAIAPVNVVVQSEDTAINSSLYEITNVTDNTNAGTAAFTVNAVSGNSNVIGSTDGSFTIAQKALTADMVTIEPEGATVNEENHSSDIEVAVKDIINGNETVLTKDIDYTVEIPDEIKSQGKYDVKVSGSGNYSGNVTKVFTLSYATDGTAALEGSTLEGNVYADTVTVRPKEGYLIAEEAEGTYEATIIYTATPSDFVVYLKNTATNEITECKLPEFTVDTEVPVFNQVTEPAPDSDWAASKDIVLDVSGADYIYYTTTEVNLGELIAEKPTGMTELQGNTLQVKANISTETTYYFYAIDKAGHVAAARAKVNKVDVDKPTISINKTIDNYADEVYWKNTDSLQIPVKVEDKLSGIKSIGVTELTDPLAFTEGAEEVEGNLEITTAGDYTITVKDLADNPTTEDFTVKQDTSAPEVTLSAPEGENGYFDETSEVYWFSSADVTVPLTIVDEAGAGDTDKAPYSVIYSTDAEFTTSTEVDVTSDTGEGSAPITLGSSGTKFTYYFKAIDAAGNENVQSITLAFDDSVPQITDASLTQLNGDAWINASEFGGENSEHKVAFSVTAEDAESGIQKIEYSSDNGQNYTKASFKEENGAYTFSTNEGYSDGTGYQWKIRVTDNVGTSEEKEIVDGKIDTTPPETKAYIKFISDTAGANDTNRGTSDDGKWTSKIWEMASDKWNKIWGKTTINFEVYVQDVTSGIDGISMKYDGTDIDLTKVEGLKAFTEGSEDTTDAESNATGYTVFEGKITCNVNENIEIKDFCIDSLTDVAGNTTSEKVVLNSAENTGIIYLDNVSPKLVSVKIGEESVTDNERYFYNEEKTVTLTIEERFFGQEDEPVYPEVIVSSKVTGGQNITGEFEKDAALSTRTWTHVDGTNQWKAEVRLPKETDKEIEYQITMDAYADPSGNILVGADGVVGVTEGAFESKIFVVDAAAPKLVNYSVSTPTECNINGAAVYKNDTLNDDLTVTFTIDDNEIYYDTSKDELVVELYNKGESTLVKTLKAGDTDLSVEHTNGEREYTYSFGYDGEAATEDEFDVKITYQDAAGNLMVDGREETNSGSMDNGIYTSEAYIIDHVAPVFDISYSSATNVVNASGENASGKQPLKDYTAYYNQNIEVTLTFDEKYVNIKDDESLEHFEFEITKDGTALKDNDMPKIEWTHNETVHEATFTIEAKTDNTTDGNYQFTVKYRDCAENAMVGNEDNADLVSLMSTGTEERTNAPVGVYTSPVLVMDTTAPEITTQYSADPARTANGIDYFKDLNTTLNITVVDRNIRYGELKTALSGMKAYNIDEESIDTELKDTIDDITDTEVQCAAGNEDPAVWPLNLPLQTEANYEIPVAFTDLAGNNAVINEAGNTFTEYVTVDETPVNENIYIKFESDVKGANAPDVAEQEDPWYSKIVEFVKFVSESWKKIWGKETIKFKVYVRDEISGVEHLTMGYDADQTAVELSSLDGTLTKIDELATIGESKYVVYSGSLTLEENAPDLAITQFQIKEVVDNATNTREHLWFAGTEENKKIYLDKTNPKLVSVEIGEESVTDNERYFYNEEKTVTLTIEERFFGQEDEPVYPEVIVSSKVTGGQNITGEFKKDAALSTRTWTHVDGTNQWKAEVRLPEETDKEIEYQITMEAYADPSGNILVGADGVVGVTEEGAFESKIFVIDTLAPKLTRYSVNAPTECSINGAAVYKNDTSNDDLRVEFTIDDNENYYETSKDNLVVDLYKNGTKELELVERLEVEHTKGEREYTYSFSYDGEADTEDEFYVEITYQDAAGNLMAMADGQEETDSGSMNNGIYKSEDYIIDHVAPVFDISYSSATNVVNASGENASGKQPLKDYTAYYNQNIEVTLTFDEKYVNIKDDESLEHFEFQITKDGKELTGDSAPEVTWTQPEANSDSNIHTMEFTIPANEDHSNDGNYQFKIKYRDCAENLMGTEKEEVQKLLEDGVYTSPVLVMDTTAPVITTQYSADPVQIANGIDYFKDLNTTLNITVVDRNIRYGELKTALSGMKAYKINEESNEEPIDNTKLKDKIDGILATKLQCVTGSEDPAVWPLYLPLQTEANYEIPVAFTDLAGNEAVINEAGSTFTECVTTDSTVPQLDLSYSVTDPANYLKWGYLFAKGQLNITVTAKDEISGIQYIKFTVIDENGKKTEKTGTFTPTGNTTYSIDIPLSTKDFKGSVLAEVFDYSTNTINQTRGHIIESAEKHSATGKAVIQTITSPSRSVGGVDFYNTDVKFKLTLEDTYSGLASWKYVGGNTLKNEYSYKNAAGTDLKNEPTKEITYSYVEELTLSASGNNENDVLVTASYVDNVGYTNEVEQKYNIDITKPEIEVTYDLNEPANGKYYKETRTATVRIRERNFDPSDVEFLITSTDGPMPQISDWSSSGSGDDTWHTCTLAFALDSDYTFTLKFQDMAGNVADYDRVDEFTIDKTIPVATITYDNNNFLNEYYYDAARTATIDILEHNFDPSAIDIMITADGQTTGVPHISAWASNGDHNIATVTFSADAEYTFDIAGLDLALNELEDYTPDHFVIDQTAPELEIFDIEHMSANNGVVRPGIRYHDTNYDKDGTVILMTGYHNGVVEMTGARKLEANGLELKLDDFAYVQEMDDIYTMHAEVYDLAGNSSEATVMFSVNRFGSVYTFDEKTDALIGDNGRYYTNKEQELVITETNVDTLEFKEITCNLNGKLTTLKEGQDYTVSLNGNEATWKQYTYTIKEDNFVEEGTYILTIYSEDRATNTSDNNSKGKKVEFVVDKTNPSVLISGVENNGQYRTNSREMTLDIEDNVRLSQVAVTIDGVETVYDSAQIYEADGKFVMNIGSANHWQEIEVAVTDAAGNEEISEEMRVLVTANIFIQYFMNKPLFYGSLGTLAAIAAFLWWFLVGKRKKENEEEAK